MPDALGNYLQNLPAHSYLGGGSGGSASLTSLSTQDQDQSQRLLAQLAQYNQLFNQAYARQAQVARGYDSVIAGTAPSVAQNQLGQGLGQIAAQQQSQASGATGTNAAIARIAAMQNTGQAQAQANQQAAMIRAQEVAQARAAQAGIAGQQAGEAGSMYGANLSGAASLANPAVAAAGAERTAQQKEDEATKQFYANLIKAGGSAIASAAA